MAMVTSIQTDRFSVGTGRNGRTRHALLFGLLSLLGLWLGQVTPAHAVSKCPTLTILLDQFPRNIYRGTPRSFAYDSFALQSAELALGRGFNQQMTTAQRMFLYLPFEHTEDLEKQNRMYFT